MKFPDLSHAVKPEPHNGMPQAEGFSFDVLDATNLIPE